METKVTNLLEQLANVGYWGISHVGAANYASRERKARYELGNTYDKLFKEGEKIDALVEEIYNELDLLKTMVDRDNHYLTKVGKGFVEKRIEKLEKILGDERNKV